MNLKHRVEFKLSKLLPREQRTSTFRAHPFDIDEIEAILLSCSREEDRNMLQFAFCTGMRPSEYIALQWPIGHLARQCR